MQHFKASTQYGDWEGTSAADNSIPHGLREYLEEKGLIKADEFLVAASMYSSEGYISVSAFAVPDGNLQNVKESLDAKGDPVAVREIETELTRDEFFDLFKRLNLVLTRRGLDLGGREYSAPR